MFRITNGTILRGQQLILAKVYKWFNGASPYSQYCGGIEKLSNIPQQIISHLK